MRCLKLFLLLFLVFSALPVFALESADYLVGDGDILKVSVYDNEDLETIVRIDSDGSIQFPLIGRVDLAGLSVSAVAQKIEAQLADGYLVNPQVAVFIQEYRSQKVVVMGQIKVPGVFELRGPTSLLELISKAGGVRDDAGDSLSISRVNDVGADKEIIEIDLQSLLKHADAEQNITIMDGDNIFVSKAGMFYVTGEANRPDAYKYEEGTTVLKAISMAGGFTKIASKGKVQIIRTVDGDEQRLDKVSMQEPVLPDDVIVVPESFF
jgi:polysaccharide export outer membrane protein